MSTGTIILALVLVAFVLAMIDRMRRSAKLNRNWARDQKILPITQFSEDGKITIRNVRNIDYRTTMDFKVAHYDKTYDLDKLNSAWFIVEPFGVLGIAHILVSFGFEDGSYVAISAEIRREVGEVFSPLRGILGHYELMYVIADERDVVRLRSNYRKDIVRLYPIKADIEIIRAVFVDMLKRANKLAAEPELYDTISNNCAVNIVRHVRRFTDKPIPWWDFRYLLPASLDRIAYDVGILDTELPLEQARDYFTINKRANRADKDPNFSAVIRRFGTE